MNLRYQAIQVLLHLFRQGQSLNMAQQAVIAEHQLQGVVVHPAVVRGPVE